MYKRQILEGEAGHQDALVRTEYALKAVTESGIAVDRLADEIANWNRGQAQTKMSQWLESYRDEIEVVLSLIHIFPDGWPTIRIS